MVSFENVWENTNIKDTYIKNKDILSKKSLTNKEKFKEVSNKIVNHKNELNYSGGEKKLEFVKTTNKGLLNNKQDFESDNVKKKFIKRFLK